MQQMLSMKITKTFIIQYPSGRWGFVGNVPNELCHPQGKGFYANELTSNVYETKEEAEQALIKLI